MVKRNGLIKFLLAYLMLVLNLSIFSVGFINPTYASQIFEAENGDTITATISAHDLTRIAIEGENIIRDYSSADLSKKIVKPLGQVYLTPNTLQSFNLYVVSNRGNTYNLKLTPSKNVGGDSIVIKPKSSKASSASDIKFTSSTYVRNINYLLELMYLDREGNGYEVLTKNTPIITYNGLNSVLLKTYSNNALFGEVILLKNISKDKLLLTEAEFYSDKTLAVAIENPELDSNKFTRVFIVRGL